MILTADDVERITGKARPSAQARWLAAHGWRFARNARGEVVIHELEAERHLYGGAASKADRKAAPDLSWAK